MSKKSKTPATEAQHERDQATFEGLPEKTKELMKLKHRNEKTTGRAQVATTRKISRVTPHG